MPLCNASQRGQTGKEVLGYCGMSSFLASFKLTQKHVRLNYCWAKIVGGKTAESNISHHSASFLNTRTHHFNFSSWLMQTSVIRATLWFIRAQQNSSRGRECKEIRNWCFWWNSLPWNADQWGCNDTICFHLIYFHYRGTTVKLLSIYRRKRFKTNSLQKQNCTKKPAKQQQIFIQVQIFWTRFTSIQLPNKRE